MMLFRSFRALNLNSASRYINFSTTTPAANGKRALYSRISPIGDWRVSIVPVLDKWIDEGQKVDKSELQNIVGELRRYRRFRHALEVSQWMTDKRYFTLSPVDMAIRLELISKVQGIDQAEIYFNNIPEQAKGVKIYGALLNCHAVEKSLEKAEDLMQKMRNLGLEMETFSYNVMLNLYSKTGNYEKLDSLMNEMEEKGIKFNKFTFGTRLTAYAATSDTEGIDKILKKMESDPTLVLDWNAYAIAANGYTKVGALDKALATLKKSEGLILKSKRKNMGFDFLLTQYATAGNRDDVLRIWEIYKNTEKIYNNGYKKMITSLLRLDDIEGAVNVFNEWESSQLSYDFRIPNYLIAFYCRKGLMGKAEAFVHRAKENGGKPLARTYYSLAMGYVGCDQLPKAVEAMNMAVSVCQQGLKQPSKEILIACFEYFKGKNEVEEAEEFIMSLGDKGIVSTDIQGKLLNYFRTGEADSYVNREELAGDGGEKTVVGAEQVAESFEAEVGTSTA